MLNVADYCSRFNNYTFSQDAIGLDIKIKLLNEEIGSLMNT